MLKRPKHRKFDYVPRFYDPQKEELEERLALYKEGTSDEDRAKARIKSGFRNRLGAPSDKRQLRAQSMRANFRLVMIIGILAMLSYMFMKSDMLLRMLESLGM